MALQFSGIVHVACADLAETLAFYSKLGFVTEGEGELTAMSLGDGFRMWPIVAGSDEGVAVGEAIVAFYCDDVRAEYERLIAQGVEFLCEPLAAYGPWEVHLRDPNGLWLMFIERPLPSKIN